jgi:DNA replication protein DnaC
MITCYQPRTALTDPSWFYGREEELEKLFSYLNSPSPQNVSIVGQRRIGKSWLLRVVALDNALRARYLEHPEQYTFIYWDLQTEPRLSPDVFFSRLVDQLLSELPQGLSEFCREAVDKERSEDALSGMLDVLKEFEHRVVLLLDEFAAITRSTEFAESFFSHLRSIFGRPEMTCVTASYRSLGEMCHLGPDSPFFNIFSRIQLGLFSWQKAQAFVLEPFEADGIRVEPGVVREILRLTGPHPCFISQLCHELAIEIRATGALTKEDVERHNGPFQTAVFDDFAYYLQRLSEDELALLRHIAEGNQPATLDNPIYLRLKGWSLVREHEGKAIPFSIPFGQFIKDSKGTDVYFEKSFSDTCMSGPSFVRIAEIMLAASSHISDTMRGDLESAIRAMQGRPQDAMAICGRHVLDPLLKTVAGRACAIQYDTRYQKQSEIIAVLEPEAYNRHRLPLSYVAHFQSIRVSGNHGSHEEHRDACTPARAFLTVLETIHLAEEIGKKYGM